MSSKINTISCVEWSLYIKRLLFISEFLKKYERFIYNKLQFKIRVWDWKKIELLLNNLSFWE